MKTLKTHDDHRWHDVRSNFNENCFVRESFEGTHTQTWARRHADMIAPHTASLLAKYEKGAKI